MSEPHQTDPRKLPLAWRDRPERDLVYHQAEWSSGTAGGGSLPSDFRWPTNPKQQQEEYGSGAAPRPSKAS
jgi:hypothetical protein